MMLSTAVSLFVLREVLMSRIDDQVTQSLTDDVQEFQRTVSAQTQGPATGGDELKHTIDVYLRQHGLVDDSAVVAYVDGSQYATRATGSARPGLVQALNALGQLDRVREGEIETQAGTARYVAVPAGVGPQTGSIALGRLLGPARDEVEKAVRIAVGVSLVVLLLASLFIWLAAGRALAPLEALTVTAQSISESDLSRRIPVRGGDELAQLARTFNAMLDRLETAFADQKEFLADVSHELRTPITVIRGHVETLGDDPLERDEAITVIQDELDRMNRFVDDLLLLIRAARPDFLRPEPLDLDLLTHDLFAKARLLGDRSWSLAEVGVGIVRGDPQRLTQAVMNLAENAVRHTRDGEGVAMGSSHTASEVRLWVRDEGPGIDLADQELIFERFARAAADRSPGGSGLGLAIVQAIAEAHGGRVELHSSRGDGATFTIVIPV
jgi:signal transduction histidine kinase